jgi:hypothetical protein
MILFQKKPYPHNDARSIDEKTPKMGGKWKDDTMRRVIPEPK